MDFPEVLKLEVNQEDIDEATRDGSFEDAYWCPIARAVRRYYPTCDVEVDGNILIDDGYGGVVYTGGEGVARFISNFDHHQPVAPVSFTLTLREPRLDVP